MVSRCHSFCHICLSYEIQFFILVKSEPLSTQDDDNPTPDDDEMDDLTVEELASLLQNFKTIGPEVQKQLMTYMKKLEKVNPKKVKEVQSYITRR